jgi:GNAT superfamily N-acetyltransferase
MSLEIQRDDGLLISDDRSLLNRARIRDWLAAAYWSHDRTAEQVERSLDNSLVYGVYSADGDQIALTRATTDLATFAWLGDVYVDEGWRGKGIGRWLVGSVVDHLRDEGVNRFVLATRDAHGVYAALGFTPLRVPSRFMEIDERAVFVGPADSGPRG